MANPVKKTRKPRGKRGNGYLYKKAGSKRWTMQFYVNGKRCIEPTGTADKPTAQRKLRDELNKIQDGTYRARPKGKRLRVVDLYELLRVEQQTNQVKRPKRPNELPGRWKHLASHFGDLEVTAVDKKTISEYREKRRQEDVPYSLVPRKVSDATINRELTALRRIFNFAHEEGAITVVPPIKILHESDEGRGGFVTHAQYAKLYEATSTLAADDQLWMRLFLAIGYTYGWRKNEILNLQVKAEHVDFKRRVLSLDSSMTKNKKPREVPMSKTIEALLREAVAGKAGTDYLLTREGDKHKRITDIRFQWWALCCAAGLGQWVCPDCEKSFAKINKLDLEPRAHELKDKGECRVCGYSGRGQYVGLIPHDLRRSAARSLRDSGVPENVVMGVGGWRTPSMFRRYSIVNLDDQIEAMRKLEEHRAQLDAASE
jgi:integrase